MDGASSPARPRVASRPPGPRAGRAPGGPSSRAGGGRPRPFRFTDDEIRALGDGDVVVRDGVLGEAAACAVRAEIEALDGRGVLAPAAVGRDRALRDSPAVRGDLTAWLEPAAAPPALARAHALFEGVRRAANAQAWLGLQAFEVQLARYPGDGTRYLRHRDAFRLDPRRRLTAILYANPGWRPEDGGVLRAWTPEGPRDVAPVLDRLVLFLSERVEHEVQPAWADRYAVTAWFRSTP